MDDGMGSLRSIAGSLLRFFYGIALSLSVYIWLCAVWLRYDVTK